MRRGPHHFTILILVSTSLSILFYFTNCYEVVGTGNPKPRPVPITTASVTDLVRHVCQFAASCDWDETKCEETLLHQDQIALALGLNMDRHSTLEKAQQSEARFELTTDQDSLTQCIEDLFKQSCPQHISSDQNENGLALIQNLFAQNPNCRRGILDHFHVTKKSIPTYHDLQPLAPQATRMVGNTSYLGVLDTSEIRIFALTPEGPQTFETVRFASKLALWSWGPFSNALEVCGLLDQSQTLDCQTLGPNKQWIQSKAVNLSLPTAGKKITDTAISSFEGDPTLVLLSNSGDQLWSVDSSGTVRTIGFPSGWGSPFRFEVAAQKDFEILTAVFPGKGIALLNQALKQRRDLTDTDFVAIPELKSLRFLSQVEVQKVSANQYPLAILDRRGNLSIQKMDLTSMDLTLMTLTSMGQAAVTIDSDEIHPVRLSGSHRGILANDPLSNTMRIFFYNDKFGFTLPVTVPLDSPVLDFVSADLNLDGHDDLVLMNQKTDELIWLQAK